MIRKVVFEKISSKIKYYRIGFATWLGWVRGIYMKADWFAMPCLSARGGMGQKKGLMLAL
jgi:hypothetical protein